MTEDLCLRCGRTGHMPEDCSWPLDTEDLPEPKPPPEPDPPDWCGGFILHD